MLASMFLPSDSSPSIIRKVILGASHPRLFFLHSISPHTSPKKPWRDRWTLFPHGLCLGKVQLLQRGSHLSSLPELPSTHGEWGMPHGSATGCQQSEGFHVHKAYIYIFIYLYIYIFFLFIQNKKHL